MLQVGKKVSQSFSFRALGANTHLEFKLMLYLVLNGSNLLLIKYLSLESKGDCYSLISRLGVLMLYDFGIKHVKTKLVHHT